MEKEWRKSGVRVEEAKSGREKSGRVERWERERQRASEHERQPAKRLKVSGFMASINFELINTINNE